jgi:hypothetical protein
VQFLVRGLVITCHTTYPKLAREGSWILRYHRSRFFTFIFFMPKLSGNSLDKFNKSCIALHQTSRKVDFAFFRFFYDFLETLQESAIWLYYWRCTFTLGTLQRTKASHSCPWFTEKPSERFGACNVALGHGGGAARPIPARPAVLPAVQGRGEEGMLT